MQNRFSHLGLALLLAAVWCGCDNLIAAASPRPPALAAAKKAVLPAKLDGELKLSLERSTAYLLGKQMPDGSWLQHPAVTGLACTALAQSPAAKKPDVDNAINKGLDFVLKHIQADGSIWNKETEEYPNYSTAISLICLIQVNRPQDQAVIRAARDFLLKSQFQDVPSSDPSYGGIGYGKAKRPDLSNSQWALEALYLTDHLDREPFSKDPAKAKAADLCWSRAIEFLSRCQNLKGVNDQVWVATDPENRGGFVYMPGESKAGAEKTEEGETLRSYGSMTYAGLKSMIYARVEKDDPRVKAAVDWLRRHYTFDENPGMGAAGLYYYLHTSAKALAALGDEKITDATGKSRPWREELIASLIKKQQPTGEWLNENGRWMENVPELVTCYSMITLEIAAGSNDSNAQSK